jgi:uncharacterized protein (TIGR02118 family)
MIKLTGLMNRRDLMPRQAFADYYLGQNVALASRLPGLRKYVGGLALMSAGGEDPPFDACSQLYWETLEEIREIFLGADWNRTRSDHPNMINGRTMLISEEHELLNRVPAGMAPIRHIAVLTRKDGMSSEAFRAYWLEKHVELALQTPHLLRYRACPAIAGANDDVAPFDGIAEMWFENVQRFRESFADPFWEQVRDDYYANFAMGRIQLLLEDHVFFDESLETA